MNCLKTVSVEHASIFFVLVFAMVLSGTPSAASDDETCSNLLCQDIWSTLSGTWNLNTSTCVMTETAFSTAAKVAWLGNDLGDTPTPTFNFANQSFTFSATYKINDDGGHSNVGVLFRAKSVGYNNLDGQSYLFTVFPNSNKAWLGRYNDNWANLQEETIPGGVEINQVITVTVVSNPVDFTLYDFYINDTLIMQDIELTEYTSGSFALRGEGDTTATYYNINITLFDEPCVDSRAPTVVPTSEPSAVPTSKPSFEPSSGPSNRLTSVPTDGPTEIPTVGPTEYTETPTDAPTSGANVVVIKQDDDEEGTGVLLFVIIGLLLVVVCVMGFMLFKMKKKLNDKDKQIEKFQDKYQEYQRNRKSTNDINGQVNVNNTNQLLMLTNGGDAPGLQVVPVQVEEAEGGNADDAAGEEGVNNENITGYNAGVAMNNFGQNQYVNDDDNAGGDDVGPADEEVMDGGIGQPGLERIEIQERKVRNVEEYASVGSVESPLSNENVKYGDLFKQGLQDQVGAEDVIMDDIVDHMSTPN